MIRDVLEKTKGGAFIPYITAGYPDADTTIELARIFAENGADILELGIPFSDPLADGPVIQESFQKALEKGVNVDECFRIAGAIRDQTDIPVIFMISYNLILQKGLEAFADLCVLNSVKGLIIPDLSPESAEKDHALFQSRGLDTIFLIAPNTSPQRRDLILKYSSGYLYCLSRLGITGMQTSITEGLDKYLNDLREHTALPLCVGFGISKPEHVREVCRFADGAIVGSAIVKMITEYSNNKNKMFKAIGDYVKGMKQAAEGEV